MLSRFLVILFAACASLPLFAQAQAPTPERRTIAVSVLDKEGKAVHGLTAENFRGEFRGLPVKILSATEDSSPRRIAILVDASAGMDNDRHRWGFAWAAAQDAIARLTPQHEVALYTFADQLVVYSELTRDRALLLRDLETARVLGAKKSTALLDAISETVQRFGTPTPGDSILVITDGIDNASYNRLAQVEQLLQRAGVRVFVVWIRPTEYWRRDVRQAERQMRSLAQSSGGLRLEPRGYKADDLSGLQPIYAEFERLYLVEVEVSALVDKPREWKLEVVGPDGHKDLEVAYPRLLVPFSDKK